MYLPGELTTWQVQIILSSLKITWDEKQVNDSDWVKIQSPFSKDKTPSFSISISKGCFKDWVDPDVKGDIISLVMRLKGYEKRKAEEWVANTINRKTYIPIYK